MTRTRLCDCRLCPCSAEVDPGQRICAGCKKGTRCIELRKLQSEAFHYPSTPPKRITQAEEERRELYRRGGGE